MAAVSKKKVLDGTSICVFCKSDAETSDLIMFECTYSSHIWDMYARRFGVNININLKDTLWNKLGKSGHEIGLFKALTATEIYG